MNILVANNHLDQAGGTENYTYAIIVELLRLGHHVEYFTFKKGFVSDLIEELGVKFMDKYVYDFIIANHNTTVKYLYKRGYIIQTCHGIYIELEQPSEFAKLYVSISYEVQKHLENKGIKSIIIKNGIDCIRFRPQNPISNKLTCVLSLCQSEEANDFILKCCKEVGVKFIKVDKHTENKWDIEDEINKSDMVVGIGRSIYDAMACGRTIISFDNRNYSSALGDGYLNNDNIEQSLKFNCTGRGAQKTFNQEMFISELKKYNKFDGLFMRNYALENLNIRLQVKHYLDLMTISKLIRIRLRNMIKMLYIFIKSNIL